MTAYSRVASQQAGATIEFPREAVSCAFAETFSLFVESLNVGLGASEENDFDHGLPRRTLALTTSHGVPCEGSFWYSRHRWSSKSSWSGVRIASSGLRVSSSQSSVNNMSFSSADNKRISGIFSKITTWTLLRAGPVGKRHQRFNRNAPGVWMNRNRHVCEKTTRICGPTGEFMFSRRNETRQFAGFPYQDRTSVFGSGSPRFFEARPLSPASPCPPDDSQIDK